MIRVVLPQHLRTLASLPDDAAEVSIDLSGTVSQRVLLDALEERYPVLRGTIRDRVTGKRRPFVRFFAGEEDISHDPQDDALPDVVTAGKEPLYIIGAMAGG